MDRLVDCRRHVGFRLGAILLSILSLTAATEPLSGNAQEKGQTAAADTASESSSSQSSSTQAPNLFRVGQSVAPLYGPWKFQVGDSPVDPVTRTPVWAQANFDDTGWEMVSLAPTTANRNASPGEPGMVPGWTEKGHPDYSGFAWYRIRLDLETQPSQRLSLAVSSQVNDAYQVFLNGQLLGSFGDLTASRPVSYYPEPMVFPFAPNGKSPSRQVIAFRVWMDPKTLGTTDESGGLRAAPLIGENDAIAVVHQVRWLELIRTYSPFVIDAVLFALLAIMHFSFILFDRTDRVYRWMGIALTLMSAYSALGAFDLWTPHLSILEDQLLVRCTIGPLAYAAWFMVWWEWFPRKKRSWMPIVAMSSAVAYMVSKAIALLLSLKFPSVANTFDDLSLIVSLLFFTLLLTIVIEGIRHRGVEGWLVLPAILLLTIPPIQDQPFFLRVSPSWIVFGTEITLPEVAQIVLVLFVALLLLRRLLLSVRRHRLIELDAKRAQLQSDFVAAVSHEFRSPLTTLKSITDLLVQGRIGGEARRRQSYVFLDRETLRLQNLVEDLLDFGRMESGRKQYRMALCDLFQLARAAVSDLHEQAEAEGFHIETSLNGARGTIRADEEALRRAIRNLLENAMKYSPQCRTVWVDGAVNGRRASISVRDQGMGIDLPEQRAIFQKFYRGDAAKKAGINGTGIGLAMVQQISEAMGGEIRLQSEVGVGSTFTIVLPLVEE